MVNQNQQRHMPLDFEQVEELIKMRTKRAGNVKYLYPGMLVDSDTE